MAQRAGLLPLILHSTFNHELMQQQQQQYAGQTGVTSDSSEAYAAANKKLAMEDDT
jgi:hypothetical protein